MNRLLVLHHGALGDFILSMSVIQAVRANFEIDHTIAIASASSAAVAAGRSAIDERLAPEDVQLHTLFATSELSDRLRRSLSQADVVLNFLSDQADPIHRRLRDNTDAAVYSVDPRPTAETVEQHRHITAQWAASLRAQGVDVVPTPPVIHVGLTSYDGERDKVVIHPGSGNPAKCWPIEEFLNLAHILEKDRGCEVTWCLGPAEVERGIPDIIRKKAFAPNEPEQLCSTLDRIGGTLIGADLYVGNDAGTTHFAAALGIPTIVIFTATDPAVWRPLNSNAVIIPAELNNAAGIASIRGAVDAILVDI